MAIPAQSDLSDLFFDVIDSQFTPDVNTSYLISSDNISKYSYISCLKDLFLIFFFFVIVQHSAPYSITGRITLCKVSFSVVLAFTLLV